MAYYIRSFTGGM